METYTVRRAECCSASEEWPALYWHDSSSHQELVSDATNSADPLGFWLSSDWWAPPVRKQTRQWNKLHVFFVRHFLTLGRMQCKFLLFSRVVWWQGGRHTNSSLSTFPIQNILTANLWTVAILMKLWARPFSTRVRSDMSSKSWRKWKAILSTTISFTCRIIN